MAAFVRKWLSHYPFIYNKQKPEFMGANGWKVENPRPHATIDPRN